jgi:hypothetical protein
VGAVKEAATRSAIGRLVFSLPKIVMFIVRPFSQFSLRGWIYLFSVAQVLITVIAKQMPLVNHETKKHHRSNPSGLATSTQNPDGARLHAH